MPKDDEKVSVAYALFCVSEELKAARKLYPDFPTAMHGISVLREEFEELWEQLRVKDGQRDQQKMWDEAVQVAAMAVRFMLDCCPDAHAEPVGTLTLIPAPPPARTVAICDAHHPDPFVRCWVAPGVPHAHWWVQDTVEAGGKTYQHIPGRCSPSKAREGVKGWICPPDCPVESLGLEA